jgi:hypothetical protein
MFVKLYCGKMPVYVNKYQIQWIVPESQTNTRLIFIGDEDSSFAVEGNIDDVAKILNGDHNDNN